MLQGERQLTYRKRSNILLSYLQVQYLWRKYLLEYGRLYSYMVMAMLVCVCWLSHRLATP